MRRSSRLLAAASPAERASLEALERLLATLSSSSCSLDSLFCSHLKLESCGLTDAHAPALVALVRRVRGLVALDLAGNGLTDVSAQALALALPDARALERLDLSGNAIGAAGFEALAAGIACAPSLEDVKLGDNPGLGAGWACGGWKHFVLVLLPLAPRSRADGAVRSQRPRDFARALRDGARHSAQMRRLMSEWDKSAAVSGADVEPPPFVWLQVGAFPPAHDEALFLIALALARGDEDFASMLLLAAWVGLEAALETASWLVAALFHHDPPRAFRFVTLLASKAVARADAIADVMPLDAAALRELSAVAQLALRGSLDAMATSADVRLALELVDAAVAAAAAAAPAAAPPLPRPAHGGRAPTARVLAVDGGAVVASSEGGAGTAGADAADAAQASSPALELDHVMGAAGARAGLTDADALADEAEIDCARGNDARAVRALLERADVWLHLEMAAELGCGALLASGLVQDAHSRAFLGDCGAFWLVRARVLLPGLHAARTPRAVAWAADRARALTLFSLALAFLAVHALLEPAACVLLLLAPSLEDSLRARCVDGVGGALFGRFRPLVGGALKLQPWVLDPWFRFALAWLSDVALAALILHLPPPELLAPGEPLCARATLALVWILTSLASELGQLVGLGLLSTPRLAIRRYFAEVWNLLDMAGLLVGAVAVATHAAVSLGARPRARLWRSVAAVGAAAGGEALLGASLDLDESAAAAFLGEVRLVQGVLASSVWFLLVRLCRLTYLSPTLGPMMRMVWLMGMDVMRCVFFGTMFSLAAAGCLVVLFKVPLPAEGGALTDDGAPAAAAAAARRLAMMAALPHEAVADDECAEGPMVALFEGRATLFSALAALTEVWLTGEAVALSCARRSGQGWLAWAMLLLFALTTVVCILNMLIAQMAKTFDTVWEARATSYLHSRAQIIQRARGSAFAPPPLNLIGLPSQLALAAARALAHCRLGLSRAVRAKREFKHRQLRDDDDDDDDDDAMGRGAASARALDSARAIRVLAAQGVDDGATAAVGAAVHGTDQLSARVLDVVEAHLDDSTAEERWRVSMLGRIRGWFDAQTAALSKGDGRSGGGGATRQLEEDVQRLTALVAQLAEGQTKLHANHARILRALQSRLPS